jgi:hypothetical protein
MAEDTGTREIGRVTDDQGRVVIVGTCQGRVTLRTLRTRTSGAVELTQDLAEDFGQLYVAACWQAGRDGETGTVFAEVEDEETFRAQFEPGRRVRFEHPDRGHDIDQETAAALLTPGEVYTIEWSAVGQSSSRLGLAGVDAHGQGFNSVLFEPVDELAAIRDGAT